MIEQNDSLKHRLMFAAQTKRNQNECRHTEDRFGVCFLGGLEATPVACSAAIEEIKTPLHKGLTVLAGAQRLMHSGRSGLNKHSPVIPDSHT